MSDSRPSQTRILIVEDEEGIRSALARLVRREGYQPVQPAAGEDTLSAIRRTSPDALLLDIKVPGPAGIQTLRDVKRFRPALPVIVMAHGAVRDAVAALRAGAHDYLLKPFDHGDVIRALHSAMATGQLQQTVQLLSDRMSCAANLHEIMGSSKAVSRVCEAVARVACSDFTVLIIGETGTGKELVAQAIHRSSRRAHHPFVAVDCGAIPENLFESEVFGHEKGAFTGADRSVPGKFEVAGSGTLFLDEISNMRMDAQAKLLRALQERCILRVGGNKPIEVDARVIAVSNRDLEAATRQGTFRRDLFFRLNEFTIEIPPLRERKDDISYLAKRFLDSTNQELGKAVAGFSPSALERLLTFDWPGNVRQLRSMIRRAVLLAEATIEVEHLDFPGRSFSPSWASPLPDPGGGIDNGLPLKQLVHRATAEVERAALAGMLTKTGWNKAKAARLLRIDYKTIHAKLKEYGLTKLGGEDDVKKKI